MARRTRVLIRPLGFERPVAIAAEQLAEYLPRLAPVSAHAERPLPAVPSDGDATIVLGTSKHLAGLGLGTLPKASVVDDAFAIVPKNGKLYLAGANPRSVLFAAYRLLEEMGAVFLRPGPGGEVLPSAKALRLPKRAIREKASYRHRGICIEGAPRLEHVLGLLDWMAKKKMNTFQLQFRHSGVFWRLGFKSPEMPESVRKAKLDDADCYALDERVIERCKELGFVLHRVGHGWTAFALGLPGYDWSQTKQRPDKDKKDWPALVNGKRELWEGKPVNTELCYSRPEIRGAMVEEIVSYAKRHREVDVLHVWMSDSLNNKCECEKCAEKPASDWYAMVMNAIGRRLKAEGLRMRVLFLSYVDLLWPPEREQITEDNVVYMYAPITRCFRHALLDAKCDEPYSLARPKLNQYEMPRTNRAYADVQRMWKKQNLPDTFLFDYHLMWATWQDGFGFDLGDVMARDMKRLDRLGLDGMVSCQAVRAFYPLPYAANAMADMLWNKRLSVSAHRDRIMKAAFGKYASKAEAYFKKMIEIFSVGKSHDHRSFFDAVADMDAKRLDANQSYIDERRRFFVTAAGEEKDPVVKTSLAMLVVHAEHGLVFMRIVEAMRKDDLERVREIVRQYEALLPEFLGPLSPWVDPQVVRPVKQAADKALPGDEVFVRLHI